MSNDLGNVPLQAFIIICLIIVHGLFVMINAAVGASGLNKESIESSNKLIIIVTGCFSAWLAFTDWLHIVIFILLLVAFGQYFPRKLAMQHKELLAQKLIKFDTAVATVLRPITWFIMLFANVMLKLFKQRTNIDEDEFSEEDVMSMLEVGQESGVLKEEGKKMINSIFAFDDKLAYEIMTPRTDVFVVDIEDSPDEYIDDLMTLRYSRIPVCKGETDNIIGILNIKDYLIQAREKGFDTVDIEPILRKAYFVPETKNIDSLFFELQKSKQQIAILIDEYGGFSGIVTLEDIIEQVMGDIDDEYDEEGEIIDKVDDNTYIVDGDVGLDNLDEELGIDLVSENSETIGGFIIDILGEIPDENDVGRVIDFENCSFKIIAVKERRIEKIKITILEKEEQTQENDQ